MSHSVAPQANADGVNENIVRLASLLSNALALIDSIGLAPEIGARLQEVIEAVDRSVADKSASEKKGPAKAVSGPE